MKKKKVKYHIVIDKVINDLEFPNEFTDEEIKRIETNNFYNYPDMYIEKANVEVNIEVSE